MIWALRLPLLSMSPTMTGKNWTTRFGIRSHIRKKVLQVLRFRKRLYGGAPPPDRSASIPHMWHQTCSWSPRWCSAPRNDSPAGTKWAWKPQCFRRLVRRTQFLLVQNVPSLKTDKFWRSNLKLSLKNCSFKATQQNAETILVQLITEQIVIPLHPNYASCVQEDMPPSCQSKSNYADMTVCLCLLTGSKIILS